MSSDEGSKATMPVPNSYCDGGVCVRLADRWQWSKLYGDWLSVCDSHAARIQSHNESITNPYRSQA